MPEQNVPKLDGEKVKLSTWKEIVKIVWKTSPKNLIVLIVTAVLTAVAESALIYVETIIIKQFSAGQGITPTFIIFAILFAIGALLFGLFIWCFIRQAGIIEANMSYELRKQSFENFNTCLFHFLIKLRKDGSWHE